MLISQKHGFLNPSYTKLHKAVFARESIRLQQDLVFPVMDDVRSEMLRIGMLADVLIHNIRMSIFWLFGKLKNA